MPTEVKEIIEAHGKNKKSGVTEPDANTSKTRINRARASLLVGMAIMFDAAQLSVVTINLVVDKFSNLKTVLDTLVSFAKFIPVVGTVIYGAYQAVDLSLAVVLFATKTALVLTFFLIARFVISAMLSHFGVTLQERMGWTKESWFNPKIFYLRKLKYVLSFFDAILPAWPGITMGVVISIFISRVADKARANKNRQF